MPTLDSAPATTYSLTLTRVIRAPRSRVYEAWTNPQLAATWFGPADMYCTEATLDVRVGGSFRMQVKPLAGVPQTESARCGGIATGTYTRVVPNELLQFTWHRDWHPGEESLVTVALKDLEGGTELTLTHDRFNSEQSRDGHNNGWIGSLDKLQAALEA